MLIKFLNRGTGKVSKAIDYLIADRDSKDELRHGVKILDGDSAWVRIVGDNLETKHKYTSAVLSWTVQDQPSAEQIRETLDEFYATAFAGLDEQRRSALAVLHEEQDGSKHVHVLMLRTDLKTGLAYNPAPPGHEYDFNCVRDYLNYKYNWSDPQDPLRKQIYKISRVERQQRIAALTEAKPINNTQKEQLELKSLLIESVNAEFARGAIQNHEDVKKFLSQFGGVRSVKAHGDRPSYISFTSPAFDKALRLRGQIFEEEFDEQRSRTLKAQIIATARAEQETATGQLHRGARQVERFFDTNLAELRECLSASRHRRTEQNTAYYDRDLSTVSTSVRGHGQRMEAGCEQPERANDRNTRTLGELVSTDGRAYHADQSAQRTHSGREQTAEAADTGIRGASQHTGSAAQESDDLYQAQQRVPSRYSRQDERSQSVESTERKLPDLQHDDRGRSIVPDLHYATLENLIDGYTQRFIRRQESAPTVKDRARSTIPKDDGSLQRSVQSSSQSHGIRSAIDEIRALGTDSEIGCMYQRLHQTGEQLLEATRAREQQVNRLREAIRTEQDLARKNHSTAHRTAEQRSSRSGYVYQWKVPKQYNEWSRECEGRRTQSERVTAATYSATSRGPSDSTATAETYAAISQRIRNARDFSEDKIRERKRQRDRDYDGPGF